MSKKPMVNPYLPSWEYIPDGEPYVFGDRVYVYGSHDAFNGWVFCQNDYVCCHLTARDEEAYVFGVSGWMDARFPKIMQDGRDGDEVNGYVCNLRDGSSAGFKYFDCRGVKAISIRTRCYANGHILVKTKWDGEALCRIPVAYTNIWTDATVPVSIPDGIQSLYFTFEGEGAVSLGSFTLHI